ncbi:MAG: hypothetical protein U0556_04735 [Dehalococcoidia bacterium]
MPIFAQILHTGRQTTNVHLRMPSWAPSPAPWSATGAIPHQITEREMDEVTDYFVASAELLRDAGYDGLEVHFGHGHLLHQFLSPAVNQRTDEYGGSEENRLRFPLAVLRAVQRAVGDTMVVGIRVSGDELVPGGLGLAESVRLIQQVHRAAPVRSSTSRSRPMPCQKYRLSCCRDELWSGSLSLCRRGVARGDPRRANLHHRRFTSAAVAEGGA